ncbi:hypothetical protein V8C35DRAFT_286984 [Trichoderma chlorosporum]
MAPGYHCSAAALQNLSVSMEPTRPTRLILAGCGVDVGFRKETRAKDPQPDKRRAGGGSLSNRMRVDGGIERVLTCSKSSMYITPAVNPPECRPLSHRDLQVAVVCFIVFLPRPR